MPLQKGQELRVQKPTFTAGAHWFHIPKTFIDTKIIDKEAYYEVTAKKVTNLGKPKKKNKQVKRK